MGVVGMEVVHVSGGLSSVLILRLRAVDVPVNKDLCVCGNEAEWVLDPVGHSDVENPSRPLQFIPDRLAHG